MEQTKKSMYTVYIGDWPVSFVDESVQVPKKTGLMYTSYDCPETMLKFIETLEKDLGVRQLMICSDNPEATFLSFCKHYRIIEAAGGLVYNTEEKILFIFRNGKWDLPKGKIENKETIEEAAVREVEEECGLKNLRIISSLPDTYHTYTLRGERILKKSYWFEMRVKGVPTLIPQQEEGITEAIWMDRFEIGKALENAFSSVADVISALRSGQ
jgi:ADP-ribose pyrophosphatase YjhB (NUDIX family)